MGKTVGLRTEILVTLTLLLGAALFLGGIIMLHLQERGLLEERVTQLESLSTILAHTVEQDNSIGDGQSHSLLRTHLLSEVPEKSYCDAWWIYNQNLELTDSMVFEPATPFLSSRRQLTKLTGEVQRQVDFPVLLNFFDNTRPVAHFLIPLKSTKKFSGILELHYSLADIHLRILKSLQIMILYVFMYGVILVSAGYFLLLKNIIRPAQNLLRATKDVKKGRLDTRLPVAGPNEIARLADAYNQMVDALQQSRAETEKHILSLEKTNQQLQQSRNELVHSEKMASVGQLAAGLAHELGNPLAALIGYLEFLKGTIESTSQQDVVKRSLVEATRIDFLVRELLNFSRPDTNLQTETVDLVKELNSAVTLLQNQGTFAEVEIVDNLPISLSPIKINRNKLQQIFVNILLNAIQACGSSSAKITLSGGDNGAIWVEIKDNGCGIKKEDLNKIFEPFYTTKPPGQGTGLGLAISQRIIAEAHGWIEIESNEGEGSLFRVVFK